MKQPSCWTAASDYDFYGEPEIADCPDCDGKTSNYGKDFFGKECAMPCDGCKQKENANENEC